MLVYILDQDRVPLGVVNTLQTLIWDRRHSEPGMFEVHCTSEEFEILRDGFYAYRDDRDELGVIQSIGVSRSADGSRTCYAKGYFAESLLNDRVIERTVRVYGTPEMISRRIVDNYVIKAKGYEGRAMDFIQLGDLLPTDIPQEETNVQLTGKAIGDYLYSFEAIYGFTHRLRYTFEWDNLYFTVAKGKDIEKGVMFATEYRNVLTAGYSRDSSDAPNVVYVAGCGEGVDRIVRVIDAREDPTEYARELYVDARDLQKTWTNEDGETEEYTDEEYDELLYNRGLEKLASHQALDSFDLSVDPNIDLIYLQDYDVGDWCTVRLTVDRYGNAIQLDRQITAIRETYEGGKTSLTITLGNSGPTSMSGYLAKSSDKITDAADVEKAVGVGDLSELKTKSKGNLVRAVNETKTEIGNLDELKTTEKTDLVAAINEAASSGGGGGGVGGSVLNFVNEKTDNYRLNPSAMKYNLTVLRTNSTGQTAKVGQSTVRTKWFSLSTPSGQLPKLSDAEPCDVMIRVTHEFTTADVVSALTGFPSFYKDVMCRLKYPVAIMDDNMNSYTAFYPFPIAGGPGNSYGRPGSAYMTNGECFFSGTGGICGATIYWSCLFNTEKGAVYSGEFEQAWPVFDVNGDTMTFVGWARMASNILAKPDTAKFVDWI